MGVARVLKGAFIVCILININLAIAVDAASDEEIDDSHITVLTSKNFSEIVKPAKHALVQFYAPWCGHCKGFRADFASAAKTITLFDSSILVAKVDADTEKDIGERFSIEGFPTFKWFEDGEPVAEFSEELSEALLVEWVKKASTGSSGELTSMKQAEVLVSNERHDDSAPILVIGYFKNGFENNKEKEYKAFQKLAMAESSEKEASFYRTSDPKIAEKLGITLPNKGSSFSLAIRRNYPDHPGTTIQYSGHKAESLDPSTLSNEENASPSEEDLVLEKFKYFFYAEKLPDFTWYDDAIEDGGNLVMSVPIDYHMYIVAPPEKLKSESTVASVRKIASLLRGQITIVAADPAAEEDNGMTAPTYPIASTFAISPKSTDFVVGVMEASSGARFTCGVLPGVESLDVDLLVKCGEEVLAGKGTRIYNSQPAPENPKQGNFTIVVGTTLHDVVKDPKKDVLLEVYAPWCGACRTFAPEYAKLAAAMAGVDSVVVAKMDGGENDHREYEVQEFPTLLFYPAKKDAEPIKVDATDAKDLAKFIHKNAKISFKLPDLAPFQDMEVDLTEFDEEDVGAEGEDWGYQDSEEDIYDEGEEEEVYEEGDLEGDDEGYDEGDDEYGINDGLDDENLDINDIIGMGEEGEEDDDGEDDSFDKTHDEL